MKKNILPILLILCGVIDQSTDLMIQFLNEIGAKQWIGTLIRIIVITIGAFRLYLTAPPVKKS